MCSYATVFYVCICILVHINQLLWCFIALMLTKTLCFVCFLKTLTCCKQICSLHTKCT